MLYETSITLEDFLNGKKIEIDVQKDVECDSCKGSGCASGTSKVTCSSCNGQGQVRQSRRMGFASFVTVAPCTKCKGQGKIVEKPCKNCKGIGKRKGTRHVSFDVPAGIDSGDYTIQGEGEYVPDGNNGDLIVRIHVQPHSQFKRDGADLFFDQKISMIDAVLGKEIDVPTLEKSEKIKIEQGTQPNAIIKLKGKGLPRQNSWGHGDQYVRLVVDIPKKLSKHQKKLLEEFKDSLD
jgi:molecular chaperone DnaJ